MNDPTGRVGPHPELGELILATLNDDGHPDMGIARPITMDRLEIACQRTWHDIRSHSTFFDGASFTACQVRIQHEPHPHSLFIQAMQRSGEKEWGIAGLSGGARPPRPDGGPHHEGGFSMGGDLYLCAGGLAWSPKMHTLQLELTDGTVLQDSFEGGCAILFVPFQSPSSRSGEAALRMLDIHGDVLVEDRVPLDIRPHPPQPSAP